MTFIPKLFILFILFISYQIKGKGQTDTEDSQADSLCLTKVNSALDFCQSKGMNTDFCILIDMKIHSGKKRLFVWSFKENKIMDACVVCHGAGGGSTPTKPVFSNTEGSHCTSLGKYKLGIRSHSKWGINIHYKMHGLESTNNNAYKRIVVFHSHSPVPETELYPFHLPMGWSLGCPVIPNKAMQRIDSMLQKAEKPVLMWIYYGDEGG